MACNGGCVGGPGRLLPPKQGQQHVERYGQAALAHTPVENPQVYAILARLGHENELPALSGTSTMAELLARKLGDK
jgi:iron only hydrogenase large subunit-like protein